LNGSNGDGEIVIHPIMPGIFITLHSYADEFYGPFSPGTAPNNAQLRTIGRKLADITGVMNASGGIGYAVDGSSDDWVYGKLGVAAFTYEIGPDYGTCGSFFPSYDCQDGINGPQLPSDKQSLSTNKVGPPHVQLMDPTREVRSLHQFLLERQRTCGNWLIIVVVILYSPSKELIFYRCPWR
jgi:hypothetical protein